MNLSSAIPRIEKLKPNDQMFAMKETAKALFLSDFFLFAKHCMGYKDLEWDVHGECVRTLESDAKRKLIVMPRGSFKSSLGSVAYPIWRLLKDPNLTILLDSELYTNSKNLLREIKGHLTSSKFMNVFGQVEGSKWDEGEIILSTRTKNRKEASITVGGIGTTKVGQHYDCLHGDTKILTSRGWVKAKDIDVKSKVYSSDGRFHFVEKVVAKFSEKNMIAISPHYQPFPSIVTEDHRVLAFRDHSLQWIEAGNLKLSDMLAIPRIQGKTRAISRTDQEINRLFGIKDVWRLIGYWLAEGARTEESNTVRLTFAHHEDEYLRDIEQIVTTHLGVKCTISNKTKSNTRIAVFRHKQMKEILAKFGEFAHDKYLPPFALNEDNDKQIELIKGYWRGDGCLAGDAVQFGSVSFDLLSGLQLILAKHGIQSGITKNKRADFCKIMNQRVGLQRDSYGLTSTSPMLKLMLDLPTAYPTRPSRSTFTHSYWMVPIKSLERVPHQGFVYDLQVRDVHDFYLPGLIAHNCIIGDDYNSASNSDTPEKCQKVLDHYKYNLNILNPGGEYLIIGTRYAELDVIGFLLSTVLEEKYLAEGKLMRGSPPVNEAEESGLLLGV